MNKILFISQEINPYLPESDLSILSRYLPQSIQERGKEIRTFMPRYGVINERRYHLHEVIRLSGMNIIINDSDHPLTIKVASIQQARLQVYFIDNEEYFHRKNTFSDTDGNCYEDNGERILFFAKGVIETIKKLRWTPDIVHCNGWFTALIPLLIKKLMNEDPYFANSKIIFSIYNNEFPGELDKKLKYKIKLMGISEREMRVLESPTYENLIKMAINMSDGIIRGSKEINETLVEYIRKLKKPFLEYSESANPIDEINKFYNIVS
jgi:starch synthase